MALTKAQVRDRASNVLGILRLGQSLQDQDKVFMEQIYDEVYEDLKADGLANWASDGSVPNDLVTYVVYLVALAAADTYGISNDRYTRILTKTGDNGETAKKNMRRLIRKEFDSQESAKDY